MSRTFRPFQPADSSRCLEIFDANCPEFFAPNERQEFETFLDQIKDGYEVCEVAGRICGAFGVFFDDGGMRLNWIMLDPQSQGSGIGTEIMNRAIDKVRDSKAPLLMIAASHKSAPFFSRFGAEEVAMIPDGWGPGMDRIDMALRV